MAFGGSDGDAEFFGEGAELGNDFFLKGECVAAVEVAERAFGEGRVGEDFEFAESFFLSPSDKSLGEVFVRLAMMMGEDFSGFAMGENPEGVGGVHFVAIVAALGARSDAAADGFPAFVVATVFAGLDGGEGVGNLVEDGVENLFLGVEGGEGATDRDFLFCGPTDAKATLSIVEGTGPAASSEAMLGELALQECERLGRIHDCVKVGENGRERKAALWQLGRPFRAGLWWLFIPTHQSFWWNGMLFEF